MSDLANKEDLLIRYLDNELTEAEKAALESRLESDGDMREKLVNLQVTEQAIKHFGTTQQVAFAHAQMMLELKHHNTSISKITKIARYTMAVAASLLILFIGVRIYMEAQLSPESLYDESFVDFTISGTRGNITTTSLIENQYQKRDYNGVTNAQRSSRISSKDSLLIGLSYLHKNQPEKAIGFFQTLAFSKNDFQEDAEFYLSLSYLKTKVYNKALPLMEKIVASPNHIYHSQLTNDILIKIKKLAAK